MKGMTGLALAGVSLAIVVYGLVGRPAFSGPPTWESRLAALRDQNNSYIKAKCDPWKNELDELQKASSGDSRALTPALLRKQMTLITSYPGASQFFQEGMSLAVQWAS